MSLTGERLLAQGLELYDDPAYGLLFNLLQDLKTRPFIPRDFEAIRAYTAGLTNFIQQKLLVDTTASADDFSAQQPRDRRIDYFLLHMSVNPNETNLLSPATYWLEVTPKESFLYTRGLPLIINSCHVEFRHAQRTSRILQYVSDDIIFAALFSLPLSKTLEATIDEQNPMAPIVIPHSHGLFLGEAFVGDEESPQSVVRGGHAKRGKGLEYMRGESLDLPITIRINTFISFRDMSSRQKALYSLLSPFMREESSMRALQAGLAIYSRGPAFIKKTSFEKMQAWDDLCSRVALAVKSDIWQQDSAIAMRHFERRNHHRDAPHDPK